MLQSINRHWSIPRRLAFILSACFLPVAPLAYEAIKGDLQQLVVTDNEIDGVAYQDKVWSHLLNADAGRRIEPSSELRELAQRHNKAYEATQQYDAFLASQGAKDRVEAAERLVLAIAGGSGLSLDAEPNTYYLMEIVSHQAIQLQHALSGSLAMLHEKPQGGVDPHLAIHVALLGTGAKHVATLAETLKKTDGGAEPYEKIRAHVQTLAKFSEWSEAFEENVNGTDAAAVKAALAPIAPAIAGLWQTGSKDLVRLFEARKSRIVSHATMTMGMVLAIALAALVLAVAFARSLAGSLKHQIVALDKISNEDDTADVGCLDCTNESGAIANALTRLKASVVERKRLAEEAKRQGEEAVNLNAHYAREHERFMKAFRTASDRMAAGDFKFRITEKVIDEYVEIVEEMNKTAERLDATQSAIRESDRRRDFAMSTIGQSLSRLAAGDLRVRVDAEIAAEFENLKKDFNGAVEQLERTMTEVKSGTEGIKSGTDEISQASDDLSRRTENQAASLEQTAAAVAEITSTVKKTATSAGAAHDVVSGAKNDAERSGEIVRRAIDAMSAIEKSSQQISQIIGVIDEIAFQTNLLALNAGVEAARAGDAGRGFAVVASEVRALAQRSAEAAKEIKGLISASTGQVAQGVDLVGQTGEALDRIVRRVAEINSVVSEIATSATEQANALAQVNTAVNQMDQVTQQNAAMVEESTAATRTLQQQTDELMRLVARFEIRGGSVQQIHRGREQAAPSRGAGRKAASSGARPAASGHAKQVVNGGWEEF